MGSVEARVIENMALTKCALPFPPITISGDTEDSTAHRPEHQHKSNAPGDVGFAFAKRLGKVLDNERDGEEVKGIPGPGKKGHKEEQPLLGIQQHQKLERVGCFGPVLMSIIVLAAH